ncbi:MAG: 30S ribosomal protein S3 [Patescibacteria group bacterium]
MGHKVNPKSFRLGQTTSWLSKWFAWGTKDYFQKIEQDVKIRKYIFSKLKDSGVDKVEVERAREKVGVMIYSSKPGVIIGRGGAGVDEIKSYIQKKILKDKKIKLNIDIKEIKEPQLSAMIMARNIAAELERRIPYRRAMRRNIEAIIKAGAEGAKVICSGRLDGVEIARRETMTRGKIPLQTLRADIDYACTTARTTYGAIGVKVWVFKGEVFNKERS